MCSRAGAGLATHRIGCGATRFSFLTPRLAWRSRDAAGTEPKAGGGTTAAPAALGRRAAAAASATQPHRPAHARRPAPALLTPPTSRTDQTCRADRIPAAVTGANHAPRRCPCRPQGRAWHRSRQQLARHRLAGAAAATLPACVVRGPGTKEEGACHLSPCEGDLPRQAKHAEVQPLRPQGVARRPSAQSTRRLPASANHRRSR